MIARTRSGTLYRITEARDALGPRFTVTRLAETEPNPNGIPIGYAASTRTLTVQVGEPILIDALEGDEDGRGLYTTPVVAILPDAESDTQHSPVGAEEIR